MSPLMRGRGWTFAARVFGYAFRGAQGVSQIYSLTHDDERRLTIELDARDHVVQIRGRSNRAPTERERQIVSRWLRAEQAVALARSPSDGRIC